MNKVQKAVVIVIAVILCAGVTYTVFGSDDSEKPRFDEINLLPPDEVQEMSATEAWDGLKSRADTLVGEAADGNLSVNAMSMYVEDMRLFHEDTQTSYLLFYWEYNRDPSGLSEEYSMWETYYSQSLEIMNDAFREVLNGPGADTLRRVIGDGLADSVLAGESMTDEELRLIEAEAEAQDRYFNADPSDVETIAGIYGELIDIRGSLADLKGYDSYSEYAYEVQYGRGYSPEDTGAYKEVVKGALVPLYQILDDRVGFRCTAIPARTSCSRTEGSSSEGYAPSSRSSTTRCSGTASSISRIWTRRSTRGSASPRHSPTGGTSSTYTTTHTATSLT